MRSRPSLGGSKFRQDSLESKHDMTRAVLDMKTLSPSGRIGSYRDSLSIVLLSFKRADAAR